MTLPSQFSKGHSTDGIHGPSEGVWMGADAFVAIPATDVWTFAEDQAGVDCYVFTATGARSPLLQAPLPLNGRLSAVGSTNRGIYIADITWYYAVLTASLTSVAITCNKVGWAAPNAVAAAPTITAVTVTNTPSSLTLTASAANAFYAVKSALAISTQSLLDGEALRIRIAPVLANTGVFKFAGAQVHFAEQ